jgi:ubiquinone/menaquinone biosynthesis C-methylase UbiE
MLQRLHNAHRRLGPRGLAAAVLRSVADRVEAPWSWPLDRLNPWARTTSPTLISAEYIRFQQMPHRVLSRYVGIEGKHVLEVGGAQASLSARAFLDDGAARVVVTGLDHVTEEGESVDQRLCIMKADALDLRSRFAAGSFDLVFGLSIIEHIPRPDRFLEEVHRVLAPGGLAFFEGCPLWSSPLGHHLWVADWDGPYKGKTSANYLFTGLSHVAWSNPVPDWAHLLMEQAELEEYLARQSLPASDIACISDWIYRNDNINRLSTTELTRAYTTSGLVVLEAITRRVDIPQPTLERLRHRHGEGCDFGIGGLAYVLAKPT